MAGAGGILEIPDLQPDAHRFYLSAGYDETGVRFVTPAQSS